MKIKIFISKATAANGAVFDVFHTFDKKGNKLTVKFRKEAGETPKESGTIEIAAADCDVATNKRYPVLWIHKFANYQPFERKPAPLSDYFDDGDAN